MLCAKCNKPYELNELVSKRYGFVPGTTIPRRRHICRKCKEELEKVTDETGDKQ